MVPHMTFLNKIIASILWKFNGWKSTEEAEFDLKHGMSKMHHLCHDYMYVKRDKEAGR